MLAAAGVPLPTMRDTTERIGVIVTGAEKKS
jgi:hypothetical protein